MEMKRTDKTKLLPVLSPKGKALVEQVIDSVFEVNLEKEGLTLVEHFIESWDRQKAGTAFDTLQIVLKSLWNLCKSIRLINIDGNFVESHDLLQVAAEGFDQVGQGSLRDLSKGYCIYVEAIAEFYKMNVNQAVELFKEAKEFLQNAGKYSSQFEQMIAQMEPDIIFAAAYNSLMKNDFATAETLTKQASQAAEKVANNYYHDGEPLYYTFLGLAYYYKAYYTFVRTFNEFNQFEYDTLINDRDLVRDAIQAQEFLGKGDIENVNIKNVFFISKALVQLLELLNELAKLMQRVFRSTFKPNPKVFITFKKRIRAARDLVSEAGLAATSFISICDRLSNQIKNMERYAKPSKKDFGIYSGIVSSALFLPLFLVASWANSVFEIGLGGLTLITSCLILSLISGFGFGALRFKSLIFSIK
jgi:hypothetical protein